MREAGIHKEQPTGEKKSLFGQTGFLRADYIFLLLSLFVALGYYGLVLRYARNIPWNDDMLMVLDHAIQDLDSRFDTLFDSCADHRIVVSRIVVELLRRITGEINFRHIILVGNLGWLGVWAVFFMIWKRLNLPMYSFLAITVMIFTPCYHIAMLHAKSSILHLWVFLFALLSLWFRFYGLHGPNLTLAVMFGILAAFTRADGGLVLLFLFVNQFFRVGKSWKSRGYVNKAEAIGLILFFVLMAFMTYLFVPDFRETPPETAPLLANSASKILEILKFSALLLGGVFKWNYQISMISGLIMLAFLPVLVFNKSLRHKTPVLHAMSLFLYLSSLSIAYGRFQSGLMTAHASRYMLNSLLLVICFYGMAVKSFPVARGRRWKTFALQGAFFVLILGNYAYWSRLIHYHARDLNEQSADELIFLYTVDDMNQPHLHPERMNAFRKPLLEADELGIYEPPPDIEAEIEAIEDGEAEPVEIEDFMPWYIEQQYEKMVD